MTTLSIQVVAHRMLADLLKHVLEADPEVSVVDLGAEVVVIDATSCRPGGWSPVLEQVRAGNRRARFVLLADEDEPDAAIAAARVGVDAWLPPGPSTQDVVDVVRLVAAGAGHYPRRHLGAVLRALRADAHRVPAADGRLAALSARERDVLRLLTAGLATRDIADDLHLSVNTVRSHTRRLFAKLGVHHSLEAVRVARDLGFDAPRPTDSAE